MIGKPRFLIHMRLIPMSKTVLELIKEHLITWPQSVDSQLWNDRVAELIKRVEELQNKDKKPE